MKLYAVSTYYHALISCVKQLTGGSAADVLVTDYIPEGEALAVRLEASGLFRKSCFVRTPMEYAAKNRLDYMLNHHRKNAALVGRQIGFSFDGYDEIDIYHDDTWVARHLKDRQLRYRLVEDSLDSFKIIDNTTFAFMTRQQELRLKLKKWLRTGYLFCGANPSTICVEVNDARDLSIAELAGDKLVELPRGPLFAALTPEDKALLLRIFMRELPALAPEKTVLLLTQPLVEAGLAATEREQLDIYRALAAENCGEGDTLAIKPHPRDCVDYTDAFPQALILDKNMPAEVLWLAGLSGMKKVVSISSTTRLRVAEGKTPM